MAFTVFTEYYSENHLQVLVVTYASKGPKNSRDSPFKSTAGPGKISLTPKGPEKGFMVPVCRATKPSAPYFYNILYKIVIDKLFTKRSFQVVLL